MIPNQNINRFWGLMGVSRERVNARVDLHGTVKSLLIDGLPPGVHVNQATLVQRTNAALARYKKRNLYKNDPEMQ